MTTAASYFSTAYAFMRKDLLVLSSYRSLFIMNMLSITFAILTYFFLSQAITTQNIPGFTKYGVAYFPYVMIGIAISSLLLSATASISQKLSYEIPLGTLEVILNGRSSDLWNLFCMGLFPFLQATITSAAYLIGAHLLYPLQLELNNLLWLALAIGASLTCFIALGLFSAAAILLTKRGDPVRWLMGTLLVLLGGVYFPIDVLPDTLNKVAQLNPLTHGVELVREILLRGSGWQLLKSHFLVLFGTSLLLLPISFIAIKMSLIKIRREGSFLQH